jgi:hypothetical protein
MYFDDKHEDERDPFQMFGESEPRGDVALEEFEAAATEPALIGPQHGFEMTGLSWATFAGASAAMVWLAGAIGGPLSYFGVGVVMAMDPAMQAALVALALGPALLFWLSASAAADALKARRLAAALMRRSDEARLPAREAEDEVRRLANTVRSEIASLNDAVATALNRLSEFERSAQRNAALFADAVAASQQNAEATTRALQGEREAIAELNGELKDQTEIMSLSVGRQVRLMHEASKLVKTEMAAAEDTLENHLATMGELHHVADRTAASAHALNDTMSNMLDGLAEATRLTETARQSGAQAVQAANETAGAVRETTRAAVFEAKRAAQLIRAETSAMQEAANDTLAKLHESADVARVASQESETASNRFIAQITKRLGALAAAAHAKRALPHALGHRAERMVELKAASVVVEEGVTTLHAAARAAMARAGQRTRFETRAEVSHPRRLFKGFAFWGSFMTQHDRPPVPVNGGALELANFAPLDAPPNPDTELKSRAMDLVADSGVDLEEVLAPTDIERIAHAARHGASARRGAVLDAAHGAVDRIARRVGRDRCAQELAAQFRARPDLARSENKGEGSELVRAYLLIDAALERSLAPADASA